MITRGMVRYHDDLQPLLQPIDTVTPHPENPNNGDVDAIIESITVNGMYRPIYAQQATGHIVAGNHTWHACKELGADQIPVVYLNIDHTQALHILLADNRVAALAQPDNALLLDLLQRLDSLDGTGYKPYDIEVLTALTEQPLDLDQVDTWPLIQIRVPPHVRAAYYQYSDGSTERERLEHLLRTAGWDG